MSTFLTNSKMSPELVARIEASVSGRTPARRRPGVRPRRTALLRMTAAVSVITAVAGVAWAWERSVSERESARDALLEDVGRESKHLTPNELNTQARVERLLLKTYGPHQDDVVHEMLRAPGGLAALLAEPAIYLRGPVQAFRSESAIAQAAAESGKDVFLYCLLAPSESKEERSLLERVQAVRGRDRAATETMRHVQPFSAALVGLPLLAPAWQDRVRQADTILDIVELRRIFDRAPLEQARAAARATVLILAADEPKEPGSVTELDGATVHSVRFGLYDLRVGATRLRMIRHADPAWISERRRPHYARDLDDCRIASEIREELR